MQLLYPLRRDVSRHPDHIQQQLNSLSFYDSIPLYDDELGPSTAPPLPAENRRYLPVIRRARSPTRTTSRDCTAARPGASSVASPRPRPPPLAPRRAVAVRVTGRNGATEAFPVGDAPAGVDRPQQQRRRVQRPRTTTIRRCGRSQRMTVPTGSDSSLPRRRTAAAAATAAGTSTAFWHRRERTEELAAADFRD